MSPRTQSLLAFSALTLISAPAFACGPSGSELLGIWAFFVASVLGGLATLTLGACARRWSLGFGGWFVASVVAFVAAGLGATVGMTIAWTALEAFGIDAKIAAATTAPTLTTLAYVLWVRSRRFARAERKARVEDSDAA